jgi:tetratricopeptide (TPR) repeat protein
MACRLAHASVYDLQKRYDDAQKELTQLLAEVDQRIRFKDKNICELEKRQALLLRAKIHLKVMQYDEAEQSLEQFKDGGFTEVQELLTKIKAAREEHFKQEKKLYKKMVNNQPAAATKNKDTPEQTLDET